MIHVVFALVRFYPYYALPIGLIFAELGRYFRRKGNDLQWYCWIIASIMIGTTAIWFFFRGDIHSDTWVRYILGED